MDESRAMGLPRRSRSREIAMLGLMAALWGVIEITVGGLIKGWHVPFGGAVLGAFGVVVLLTARANVPRRGSSLAVGLVAAGIKAISGFGGASFAAIGIIVEAALVELVLSSFRPGSQTSRYMAGILAVLWAFAHPFVLWGLLGGQDVFGFTVGAIVGHTPVSVVQAVAVIGFLILVHIALGVTAVMFVDRILLAPLARARGVLPPRTDSSAGSSAASSREDDTRRGGPRSAVAVLLAVLLTVSWTTGALADGDSRNGNDGGSSQNSSKSQSVYVFPELTVFGTRLLGPYSVFEMSGSEMEASGADNLAQVLSMVPGMIVRTNSRGEEKIGSRGLSERELVVLVDGVPLSDPYSGRVNSSLVLAGAMGTVSVTKGPAATIYGANAIGGIVEVNTAGHGQTGLGYSLSAGSDGGYSGYLRGGGYFGNTHLSGGVSANGTSDFTLPNSYEPTALEDGELRDFSSSEDMMVWGRAAGRLSETLGASVSFQVSDGSHDAPVATVASRPRYWGFPAWRETRTIAGVDWRPDATLFVEGKLFYTTNDNQLASYNDPARTQRRWLSTVSNHAIGGFAYAEYQGLSGHRISGGLNLRGDVAEQQGDVGDEWERYDATTGSLFAQDVYRLGMNDRLTFAANADVVTGSAQSLSSLNPQIAWSHSFGNGVGTRLLAGAKTRFPTLKEWYSPSIGNVDLRPEHAVSLEAEFVKATQNGSRLSLLMFDQRVTDMIVSSESGDPCENIGEVRAWGAELSVQHRVTPNLSLDMSFAMTSARDVETGADVPLVPKTTAAGTLTYDHAPAQYMVRVSRIGPRAEDELSSLPAYVLMGLRTTVETRWGDIFAGVENLFDVLYEDESGFPQPGRSFEVGIMRDLFH